MVEYISSMAAPLRHEVSTRPLHSDAIDIEASAVFHDGLPGESFVVVHWCYRWPTAFVRRGQYWSEAVEFAFGPTVGTELHVFGDLVTVISAPVPKSVESVLIAHVAGLFAADEDVAA